MTFPTVMEIRPKKQQEERETPNARKDLVFQFAWAVSGILEEGGQHTDQGPQPEASGGGDGKEGGRVGSFFPGVFPVQLKAYAGGDGEGNAEGHQNTAEIPRCSARNKLLRKVVPPADEQNHLALFVVGKRSNQRQKKGEEHQGDTSAEQADGHCSLFFGHGKSPFFFYCIIGFTGMQERMTFLLRMKKGASAKEAPLCNLLVQRRFYTATAERMTVKKNAARKETIPITDQNSIQVCSSLPHCKRSFRFASTT